MARRKTEVVIPTTSLAASAVRYPGKAARIYQPNQDWQKESYRHYAICGEVRFSANFFGNALSRVSLDIEDNGEPQDSGDAYDTLEALFNGADGQAQMMKAIGIHLTVAGECYLVGRQVEGGDVWEIVSVLEMRVTGNKWMIQYGDGVEPIHLLDTDVVIRIWTPNPARRVEADSPMRSLLPILTEIEWLTRHIFAQVSSRLAGAGILMLPQNMTFPPPPEVDGQPQTYANEADGFMLTLADAMMTPISNPESPSALVPIIVTAPDDAIDKAKLLTFWSELDSHALELRSEAIRRFALGMDLPPEQVLGMASTRGTGGGRSDGISHWGAWQIEESTIKMHIEPMCETVVNALTVGYLRPVVEGTTALVVYDTTALRLRPDRSKESLELYDRGLVTGETVRRENGFAESDAIIGEDFKMWLLRKVASGSATPDQVGEALRALGVDLGVTEPGPNTRESRPPPSLEDHPSRPKTPADHALLAASDALVFRALERAGNRMRQKGGVRPNVAAYDMHTLYPTNGDATEFLTDAWSCAPQVLAGLDVPVDDTIATLDAYCRSLLAEQVPHNRTRLAKWLESA